MNFLDVFALVVCGVFFGSMGYMMTTAENQPVIKYGNNTIIYQKVFHNCVVEVTIHLIWLKSVVMLRLKRHIVWLMGRSVFDAFRH